MPYRPPADWPLLICGPILRRVEKTAEKSIISIFVATSVACKVELLVWGADGAAPWISDTHQTRRLGNQLNVCVCTVSILPNSPSGELSAGMVYKYDVRLTPQDPVGAPQSLADQEELLTGDFPLGYDKGELPTFSLPPALDRLTVLHGSCRKPHGGGPDALQIADILLEVARKEAGAGTRENALRRPHQLFLTGDQIYADDVALTLLPMVTALGQELIGAAALERFPDGHVITDVDLGPGEKRENYLKKVSTITSDTRQGHLLFFAEFCAMYLLAWSDELWARESSTARLQLEDEVRSYAESVRRVRRAMANVPTMMMFDDHEITDDWNLDRAWQMNSVLNPITKRIIRNGLLAFAVFQAWGNEPQIWSQGSHKNVLDALTIATGSAVPPLDADPALVDNALGLMPVSSVERVRWDWVLDAQSHRVIALDTRTRRGYPSHKGPAALLPDEEITSQLTDRRPDTDRLTLVIAPAPVNGYPLAEAVLQPAAVAAKGGYYGDHEPWVANRPAYEKILAALATFGRVVVLSGDVHYAFTNHMAYFGPHGESCCIVQLCSTALKNADWKTLTSQAAGYFGQTQVPIIESQGWLGFANGVEPETRADWWHDLKIQAEKAGDTARSVLFRRALAELREHPEWFDETALAEMACVPDGPWPTEDRVRALEELLLRPNSQNWAYRITYVRDTRSVVKRGSEVLNRPISLLSGIQWLFIATEARDVVGSPNLGAITFQEISGHLEVVHRLHWMTRDLFTPAASSFPGTVVHTRHVAPLSIPNVAERPVPGWSP